MPTTNDSPRSSACSIASSIFSTSTLVLLSRTMKKISFACCWRRAGGGAASGRRNRISDCGSFDDGKALPDQRRSGHRASKADFRPCLLVDVDHHGNCRHLVDLDGKAERARDPALIEQARQPPAFEHDREGRKP